MEGVILSVLAGLIAVIWVKVSWLTSEREKHGIELDRLRAELDEVRTTLTGFTSQLEQVTLTPAQRERRHFDQLPALTSDSFIDVEAGRKFSLRLLTYIDEGVPLTFPVEYVHREIVYRSPNQKDAVAYGNARSEQSEEFKEVRILFSRPNATATLRGLGSFLTGHVKQE